MNPTRPDNTDDYLDPMEAAIQKSLISNTRMEARASLN